MDIHEALEKAKSIEHQLFIKYSLVKYPTEDEVLSWSILTQNYINEGLNKDDAGRKAANETFDVDLRIRRKSQADTIEALLEKVKKKVDNENE